MQHKIMRTAARCALALLTASPISRAAEEGPVAQIAANIDGLLSHHDPAVSKTIYAVRDDFAPRYVRDSACWAASLDLTPLSVWNSASGHQRGGILISPRHVVSAAHFPLEVGVTLRWVTRRNEVIERHITAAQKVGNSDITVSLLDEAVPSTISVARLLPADYAGRIALSGLPLVLTDQEKKIFVANFASTAAGLVRIVAPTNGPRAAYFEDWIGGDSGSAALLFLYGQPVLVTIASDPLVGPDFVSHTSRIATTMRALGGSEGPSIASFEPPVIRPPRQVSGSVIIEPK